LKFKWIKTTKKGSIGTILNEKTKGCRSIGCIRLKVDRKVKKPIQTIYHFFNKLKAYQILFFK
ncbi:MAG TPA: hypothetical protein VGB37_05845, partial [Candidatus Lokiarchaeia archaeon]